MKHFKIVAISIFMAMVCMLTSCAGQPAQAPSSPLWALPPVYQAAFNYSSHAAFICTDTDESFWIDSSGSKLFDGLSVSSSHYSQDFYRQMGAGENFQFYGGVIQNVVTDTGNIQLARSGHIKAADSEYDLSGEPIRIGDVYLASVSSETSSHDYYGVMNAQKAWILEPVFCEYHVLPGGYFLLYEGSANPYTMIISPSGEISKLKKFLRAENGGEISISDDEDPWFAVADSYQRYYYIDKTGEIKLSASYEQCGHFSDGFAAVCKGGLTGYIDQSGKIRIPLQYEDGTPFSEGLAAVCKKDAVNYTVIDKTGETVFETDYTSFSIFRDHLAVVGKGTKYGIIDVAGEAVLPLKYDAVIPCDGIYLLSRSGKWGMYIPECKTIVEPSYETISFYKGPAALIGTGKKYGLLNTETGMVIQKPIYTALDYIGEGIYLASTGNDSLLISAEGEILLPLGKEYRLDAASGFHDGVAPVRFNDKWGYIANPLFYSGWSTEPSQRLTGLGIDCSTDDSPLSVQNFLSLLDDFSQLQAKICGSGEANSRLQGNLDISTKVSDPSKLLTREEAAAILAEVSRQIGNTTRYYANCCADENEVSQEYRSDVGYIVSLGIFDTPDNRFSPQATLSGHEAASVLLLFYEEMLSASDDLSWAVNREFFTSHNITRIVR